MHCLHLPSLVILREACARDAAGAPEMQRRDGRLPVRAAERARQVVRAGRRAGGARREGRRAGPPRTVPARQPVTVMATLLVHIALLAYAAAAAAYLAWLVRPREGLVSAGRLLLLSGLVLHAASFVIAVGI